MKSYPLSIDYNPSYNLDDINKAINLNTLKERVKVEKWLLSQLQSGKSLNELLAIEEAVIEKDRHRHQKNVIITL